MIENALYGLTKESQNNAVAWRRQASDSSYGTLANSWRGPVGVPNELALAQLLSVEIQASLDFHGQQLR